MHRLHLTKEKFPILRPIRIAGICIPIIFGLCIPSAIFLEVYGQLDLTAEVRFCIDLIIHLYLDVHFFCLPLQQNGVRTFFFVWVVPVSFVGNIFTGDVNVLWIVRTARWIPTCPLKRHRRYVAFQLSD